MKEDISEVSFPSFPAVVMELLQYTVREDACAEGAERIIKKDPALTAEILKIANSPLYGKGKISNLRHALTFLGLNTLKYLAITIAVTGVFSKMEMLADETGFDFTEFWSHSLRIASISQQIAQKINYQDPEEAFIAGLLHDLGRLILVQNYPKKYSEIVESVSKAKIKSFEKAEEEILGVTHTEVGAKLLDFWNLPSAFVEVAQYHHLSLSELKTTLVQIVHIAHNIDSLSTLPPYDRPFAMEAILSEIQQHWKSTCEDLEEILKTAEMQVEVIAQHLGISLEEAELRVKMPFPEQAELLAKLLIFQNIWSDLKDYSIKGIFNQAARALALAFGVRRSLYFMLDKEKNILKEVTIEGFQRQPFIIEKKDLVWEAIRQKRIVSFLELKKKGFSTLKEIESYFPADFIIMPLWNGGEIIGVVLLEMFLDKKISSLLSFIAEQIATKIKICLLTKEREFLVKEKERIREAYQRSLEKLIELEKRTAAIETAGTISHKLNQSLTVIQARIELLLHKIKDREDVKSIVKKELDIVLDESKKMNEFIKKLLELKTYKTKSYINGVEILDVE